VWRWRAASELLWASAVDALVDPSAMERATCDDLRAHTLEHVITSAQAAIKVGVLGPLYSLFTLLTRLACAMNQRFARRLILARRLAHARNPRVPRLTPGRQAIRGAASRLCRSGALAGGPAPARAAARAALRPFVQGFLTAVVAAAARPPPAGPAAASSKASLQSPEADSGSGAGAAGGGCGSGHSLL
jgi:hypothetical protein